MGKVKASASAKAKERAAARDPIASSAAMAAPGVGAKEARTANILHSVRFPRYARGMCLFVIGYTVVVSLLHAP